MVSCRVVYCTILGPCLSSGHVDHEDDDDNFGKDDFEQDDVNHFGHCDL